MKLLISSDLHIHNHEDFSTILPSGLDSRLVECLDTIDALREAAIKHDVRAVILGGDFFHVTRAVPTRVFQEAYKRMEKLTASVPMTIMNVGNHDLASTGNFTATSVYAFRQLPNTHVVADDCRMFSLSKVKAFVVPYFFEKGRTRVELAKLKLSSKFHNLLFTHCGVSEACNGPNEIMLEGEVDCRFIGKSKFDFWFAGHHHSPQQLNKKSIVIGSPHQLNMLDRGEERGFVLYDTETNDIERIILPGPHFHLYEVADEIGLKTMRKDADKLGGGYVRVLLKSERLRPAVEKLLAAANSRAFEIKQVKVLDALARNQEITTQVVAANGNLTSVIDKFVQHVKPDGLEPERLSSIGRKLLEVEHDELAS